MSNFSKTNAKFYLKNKLEGKNNKWSEKPTQNIMFSSKSEKTSRH